MPGYVEIFEMNKNRQNSLGGGAFKRQSHTYDDIISIENLLLAWKEFLRGKKNKKDVQEFQLHLMDNIFSLHQDLKNKTYKHGPYHSFNISDPKPRNIHKASVRDRLLHHAIYRILYPYFDKKFISDSYSCRLNQGTHKAINQFKKYYWKVSKNNTKQCYVLKCDVKKFFASIDHSILLYIIVKYIEDKDTVWLLNKIISSFSSTSITNDHEDRCKGLPLGNFTSQLLVNIYMNEFDHHAKHTLKIKHYIRYADDFVILHKSKNCLTHIRDRVNVFLNKELKLELHPDKVLIKTFSSGIDFLGWVHFPDHRVLRTVTKRRMMKNLSKNPTRETMISYMGMLKWGNTYKLKRAL